MARIALHPRPRPSDLGVRDWIVPVRSTAGGRVSERSIQVRYQHPRPDNPERGQRDGIILIIFTVVWTVIAGGIVWVIGPVALFANTFSSVNAFLLRVVPTVFLLVWWIISVRVIVKSTANRRGRRIIQGTVVEHSKKDFSIMRDDTVFTYTLHYLAIDDGTRDRVEGWEVPVEAWNLFPSGTHAEVLVAGDGRYPYYLEHL